MKKIMHLGYMHKYCDTRIFEKECKSLLNIDDAKIYFVTSDRSGYFCGEKDNIILETIKLKNIKIVRLFIYLNEIKKKCIELDADVYHIHEPYLLPLVPYLKRKKKKIIYDKHESTYDDCKERITRKLNEFWGNAIAKMFSKYERKCIELCNAYIYVTPQFEINSIECPSLLVPNFPKLYEEVEKKMCTKEYDMFKICYCGGIAPIWSLLELSEIIKSNIIDNLCLEIAGNGTDKYLSELKNGDTNNKIKYHGQVSFEEVKNIYRSGNVGVALLKKELGETVNEEGTLANTKIFEYMQQGLPVIYTDFPIWKRICEEYEFGISVDPTQKKEIIEAILYLKSNPEYAEKLGRNGQRAIKEKYNWQATEKEFLDLYRKVLSE